MAMRPSRRRGLLPAVAIIPSILLTLLIYDSSSTGSHLFADAQTFTPNITSGASSVFIEGEAFYIQGGFFGNVLVSTIPTFLIDLSVSWPTSNPVYKKANQEITLASSQAPSTLSADNKLWIQVSNTYVYTFNIQNNSWLGVFSGSAHFTDTAGMSMATDPDSGLMYLPNGIVDFTQPSTPVSMAVIDLTGPQPILTAPMKGAYVAVGALPTGLSYVVWSAYAKCMLMFGGINANNAPVPSTTLFRYTAAAGWITQNLTGTAPVTRSSGCFVSAYGGSKMVLFGGMVGAGPSVYGDLFFLDLTTWNWTQGPSVASVDARHGHVCAISGDYLIVWGGWNSASRINANTVLAYNMKTNAWTPNFVTGPAGQAPSTPSSGSNPGPSGSGAGSSHTIPMVASIAGVLVVAFAGGGLLLYRRRARRGQTKVPTMEEKPQGADMSDHHAADHLVNPDHDPCAGSLPISKDSLEQGSEDGWAPSKTLRKSPSAFYPIPPPVTGEHWSNNFNQDRVVRGPTALLDEYSYDSTRKPTVQEGQYGSKIGLDPQAVQFESHGSNPGNNPQAIEIHPFIYHEPTSHFQ